MIEAVRFEIHWMEWQNENVKDIAERLGVSMSQARNLIASGKIAGGVNVSAGKRSSWRVSEKRVIEFEQSRGCRAPIIPRRRSQPFIKNPVFVNGKFVG